MKKLFFFLSLVVSLTTFGQVYNPSLHTVSNKSYGQAQAGPTDARSYFYDEDNFKYRPYVDTAEVKSYLTIPKYRTGQFDIVVNTGGTLGVDGVITGGTNAVWYFKDGTDDDNLVLKGGSDPENFGVEDDTADADRSFTWGTNRFTHTFDGLAGASGWKMTSSSTAAASNLQRVLDVQLTGANANATQRTSAIYAYNGHSGTFANSTAVFAEIDNTTSSVAQAVRAIGHNAQAIYANSATPFNGVPVMTIQQDSTGNGLNVILPLSSNNPNAFALTAGGSSSLGAAAKFSSNYQKGDTVMSVVTISHTSSGATPGLGVRQDFKLSGSLVTERISNAFISRWTTATDASRTSAFDIKGVNNASEQTLITFAGNGQITEPLYGQGAFPGALAKLAGWTSSGVRIEVDPSTFTPTTPSWQQTIDVNRTNSGTLLFDTAMAMPPDIDNPATKNWLSFAPLVSDYDSINAPFRWNQGSFRNNGKPNEVMTFGWNLDAGGGALEAGKPGLGESWEQNYQINPSGWGDRLVEKHEIYLRPDGSQVRLGSYTINSNANTIQLYHSVDNMDFRNPIDNNPYWAIQGVTDGTSMKLYNHADNAQYFDINGSFAQDANTSNLVIGSNTSKTTQAFTLLGFTNATFPATASIGSAAATTLNFVRGDGAVESYVQSNSTRLRLNTLGTIQFAPVNTLTGELKSDVANFFTNVTVGPQTSAIARLDVENSVENITSYFDNTKGSGTKYAGIFSTTNVGTSNRGLNITSSGATENIGIRIDAPNVGASNWSIYALGTAKSYHEGSFGIGVDPAAKLHILSTTEQVRTAYDASNYESKTISSTGSATYDLAGTSPTFTFGKGVTISSGSIRVGNLSTNGYVKTTSSDGTFAVSTSVPASDLSGIAGTPDGTKFLRDDFSWQTVASGFSNPMTTAGDIIYGGASGVATRLGGAAGFLKSTGGSAPTWSSIVSTDIDATVSTTEFGYLANVTNDIQTQFDAKAAKTTTISIDATSQDISTSRSYYTKSMGLRAQQAAGSTIKAQPVGIESFRNISSTTSMTDGQAIWVQIYLPEPATLTGIKFYQSTQGNFTGDNFNGIGLYTLSGTTYTQVAVTANDPNIWKGTGGTWQSAAFTSTYAAAEGVYWVRMLYNNSAQTTAPVLGICQPLGAANAGGGDMTNGAVTLGQQGAQTTMASTVSSASVSNATSPAWYVGAY